ncbi:hypothetical protein [Neisseria shayeganii]|uniref:Uncharacterized protein n=1 Tax=Neisseria shayeganii TaxID=607712 RepID=A0A7D7SII7_9NEIS|nr:hypothetical protein [Neisseria shayeganii]QMT41389.1 hypothetical protein H3L94_05020 [Neisseria shayeganii]
MNNAKNKGGRPKTYEGEKNIRVSIAIRPRYRQAIELISKDRNTSLNEVVEFAIAQLAAKYEIEGKPVIEYIRPMNEERLRIKNTLIEPQNRTSEYITKKEIDYYSAIMAYESLPKGILSPQDKYVMGMLDELGPAVSHYFEIEKLEQAILEDWKIGRPEAETFNDINQIMEEQPYIFKHQMPLSTDEPSTGGVILAKYK